jgi:hypothetical protein
MSTPTKNINAEKIKGILSLDTISGGTFYGDGSNLSNIQNFFTTGTTLNNNILSFDRNDLSNAYSVDLSPLVFTGNTFDCNDLNNCDIITGITNNILSLSGEVATVKDDVIINENNIISLSGNINTINNILPNKLDLSGVTINGQQGITVSGSSPNFVIIDTPPIDNNSYVDQTAMIADQANQLVQYIYFDGADYWEYLGTTNGDITDYRKISDSNTDSYQGQMGRTSAGVVNISTIGTYQATGLIGTLDAFVSDGIALSTTDQLGLKNISGKTVQFKIFASADIEAGNNKVLGIILAKNGVIIPQTECRAPTGNATSFAKLITNWIIPMADGEQVTMYVTNHTTSGDITIQRCRMVAITSGGIGSGSTSNFFTTDATLSGTVLSFDRNDLSNAYSVDLSPLVFTGNTFDCNDLNNCDIITGITSNIISLSGEVITINNILPNKLDLSGITITGINGITVSGESPNFIIGYSGNTSDLTEEYFFYTGGTQDFNLSLTVDSVWLFLNGVYIPKNKYGITGTTLTVTETIPENSEIVVRYS